MSIKKRIQMILLTGVLAMSMLAACGNSSSTSADEKNEETEKSEERIGGTFVYPLNADITSFNEVGQNSIQGRAIFDPLFIVDDEEVRYYLAESYTVEDKEITIKLKDGLKWHDGEPITADDILFTFSVATTGYIAIDGEPVVYEKVDDLTVKITMPVASVVFPGKIGAVTIMPSHMFEGITDNKEYQASPAHQIGIGSGPYKVKEWNKGESIVCEKFDDYYMGTPPFDTLIFKILPNEDSREVAFQSGELSFKLISDELQYEYYTNKDEYDTYLFDEGRVTFMGYNKYSEALSDIKARQAIAYALNQEEIISGAYGDHLAEPANSIFTPSNDYYEKDRVAYVQDIEKAKQLAEESGLTGKTLTLIYDSYYIGSGPAAALIQEQLKAIGVTVDVQALDNTGFNNRFFFAGSTDWDMGIKGFPNTGDNSTPNYMFKKDSYFTQNAIISDEADALWRAAELEQDPEKRAELYAQIDDQVDADYMMYHLAFPKIGIVSQKQYGGYTELTRNPLFEDWMKIIPIATK